MLREASTRTAHDARLYGLMTEHRARGSVPCSGAAMCHNRTVDHSDLGGIIAGPDQFFGMISMTKIRSGRFVLFSAECARFPVS